jgi:hypothetical protein
VIDELPLTNLRDSYADKLNAITNRKGVGSVFIRCGWRNLPWKGFLLEEPTDKAHFFQKSPTCYKRVR